MTTPGGIGASQSTPNPQPTGGNDAPMMIPDDVLRPILEAARWSVGTHREERDYPGYIWIEWADLVRFVEATDPGRRPEDG